MRKAKIDFAGMVAENREHFPNGSRPVNACAKCGCAILDGQLVTRTLSGGPAVHSLSVDCRSLGQSFSLRELPPVTREDRAGMIVPD